MKTPAEQIAFLKEHSSSESSKWQEKAEWRKANKDWLKYSRKIAIVIAMSLEEKNMSQKQLAELMGCSPQYVCRLLKGEENLTLETLCKLENALNAPIIKRVFK
ncbi:MAG: helix-turn-helix transcriptional regulator [Alphaproteobacteria bacterium]|nr:helix-turn-helix transcriptional regulator [Alphaproteobacteria bacterium]